MSLKKINLLFKIIIIMLSIIGVGLLLFVAPNIDEFLIQSTTSTLIKIVFWLTGIPVIFILNSLWKLSNGVTTNTVFTNENSRRLVKIAYAGLIESILYAISIVIGLFLLSDNYPFFIICFFFFFLGLIISVVSALLSYIFKMASSIKNENDLTI